MSRNRPAGIARRSGAPHGGPPRRRPLSRMARGWPPGHQVGSARPSRFRHPLPACPEGPMRLDSIIKWFLPHEERFHELLVQGHPEPACSGRALPGIAHTTSLEDRRIKLVELKALEHEGDEITRQIFEALNRPSSRRSTARTSARSRSTSTTSSTTSRASPSTSSSSSSTRPPSRSPGSPRSSSRWRTDRLGPRADLGPGQRASRSTTRWCGSPSSRTRATRSTSR